MPIVKRYSNGEQVLFDSDAAANFSGDGKLLLDGVRVTATAQQINALSGLINAEGDIQLLDTAWDDLRFPAAGINPPGAASDPVRNTTDGLLEFSASQVNIIAIQAQLPHQWKEGSTLHAHAHWMPINANAGNVVWELKYKVANINEAFPAGWTTVPVTVAASGVAEKHQISNLAEIEMTGKTLSCMVLILLSRLGDNVADTYGSVVKLLEMDIHFEIDGFGSDEEFVK
jgi:hypothetical protein